MERSEISLGGELDLHTARRAAGVLSDALRAAPEVLCVDLSAVSFIDSRGLKVVLDAHDRALANGCRLVVANPSPQVERLMRMTDTLDVIAQAS